MDIRLNNHEMHLPADVETLAELAAHQGIPSGGTAITVNNKIIRREKWAETILKEGDSVVVITAAFGG